jgi:hypothetical protein
MKVRGQNGCFPKHPFALFQLLQNKHFRKTYKLAIVLGCCKIPITVKTPEPGSMS